MLIYDTDEELTESSSPALCCDKVTGMYTSHTDDRFLSAYKNSKKYKLSLMLKVLINNLPPISNYRSKHKGAK